MIFGRNPALWLGLVTAALNAAVLVFGVALDGAQVAALNVFGAAVIGLVANSSDVRALPTFAATLHDRRAHGGSLPPGTTGPAGVERRTNGNGGG